MASKDEELDAYELLGITFEATEGEIKTAYRQRSLKVHPDRHPNNPEAATKFHELNQAYELLLDPIRRTALDVKIKGKIARKERFSKFDAKRKGMQDELEEAERAVKRFKMEKERQAREQEQEAERLKEEGRRMREERQNEVTRKEQEQRAKEQQSLKGSAKTSEIGPLDTTVRVKYPLSKYPALVTASSLGALLSKFGTIDVSSIVLSMKASKKAPHKPPKFATALVSFAKIGEAHAAVCASGLEPRGMKDIEISWAEGKEPIALAALKRKHQFDSGELTSESTGQQTFSGSSSSHPPISETPSTFAPSFSFDSSESRQAPSTSTTAMLDYESITLMRLRQAERERLEKEIREEETVK